MDVIGVLTNLGFSDYEARAYVALLQRNPANGYELAKRSEVPRGNVYAVLQKLEDRGRVADEGRVLVNRLAEVDDPLNLFLRNEPHKPAQVPVKRDG